MVFLGCDHTASEKNVVTMPGGWKAAPCPWCEGGFLVEVVGRPSTGTVVIEDVHEHYNHSLNTVVRSRRHLQSLQRELGTTDYQPSAETREYLKYGREKMLHGR